jgi:hypothetical protein
MSKTRRVAWSLALGLLVLGCAGSKELARRSEVALQHGDARRAYENARASLDKDSGNTRARTSMTIAADSLMQDWKRRLRGMAVSDTLAAAEASLGLELFRAELVRYRVTLPPDAGFTTELARLREAAAARYYRQAEISLTGHRPKQAYLQFEKVRDYVHNYRDVVERLARTWELAVTRVAILPPDDQTNLPNLSRELADRMAAQVAEKLESDEFRFTRLVPMERIYDRMTVAQLGHLDREEALHLGRTLGAARVVWGRVYGLRTDSHRDRDRETVYRKVTEKDDTGATRERWVEETFEAITRGREVDVQVELDVLDADSGASLAHHVEGLRAEARTIYSDFRPAADPGQYRLVSPAMEREDPVAARRATERWKTTFGDWTVPRLIEKTRTNDSRRRYRSDYAGEFSRGSRTPVYLDDLPGVDDLARIALEPAWRPIVAMLADLDRQ